MRAPRTPVAGCVPVALLLTLGTSALYAQQAPARDSTPAPARDPHAVQPERPTVATHAYTVAPGFLEIEVGIQDARPAGATQFALPVVAKIGLASRLQLELQGGYARATGATTTSGAMDLGIALKQRLLDAAPLLHDFSVQGTLKLATGARGVGTHTTDVSLLLISSRPLGGAELDLNAGYTRRSGDASAAPTDATLLTASFGTPIRGRLGGVAELFDYPGTSGAAGQAPMVGFLVGPTWQLHSWLVLDAGAILDVRGLGANSIYAGVTYNVGRLPGWRAARGARAPR